jgi:hypothetical protein
MIKLGTGYNLWSRVIDKMLSTNKLDDFLTVADKAKKDQLLICKHFLPSWDPLTSTQLASNNGPCGTITNVQSNNYLQSVQIVKQFFLGSQAFTQPLATPGMFTFQLPSELDRTPKPKKGSQSSCSSMCVWRSTPRSQPSAA